MIRPTIPAADEKLIALAAETGVFKPTEIQALREVLTDYHAANHAHGHQCVTFEQDAAAAIIDFYQTQIG